MNDFTRPKVGQAYYHRYTNQIVWIILCHEEVELFNIMFEDRGITKKTYSFLDRSFWERRPDKDVSAKTVLRVAREENLI